MRAPNNGGNGGGDATKPGANNGIPLSVNGSNNHGHGGLGGGHFTADLSGKIARRGPAGKGGRSGGLGGGNGNGGESGPDTPRRHGGGWARAAAAAARRRWPLVLLAALAVVAAGAGVARLELLQQAGVRGARSGGGGGAGGAAVTAATTATKTAEQQQQPSLLLQKQQQQQHQEQPKSGIATTAAAPAAAAATGVATTETTTQRTGQPAPADPRRLLLATHNRLMWYYPLNDTYHILSQGGGMVRYGMFPGEPRSAQHPQGTLWTALRPHNWRPTTAQEWLVELDASTGSEVRRVAVPARFTHDVVRSGDKVYLCDTGHGHVLEMEYGSMKVLRRMELFSLKDHPNTLAPLVHNKELWVVLHNLGASDAVRVDLSPSPPELATTAGAREDGRIQGVGTKAHGLVEWYVPLKDDEAEALQQGQEGAGAGQQKSGSAASSSSSSPSAASPTDPSRRRFVMLDSERGSLILLDPRTGTIDTLWTAPEGDRFLKGLTVVDDVAFFGVSVWAEREVRDAVDRNGELAAYDLNGRSLMWRRTVPTAGLLNIVGAPQLGEASTYRAVYTPTPAAPKHTLPSSDATVAAVSAALATTGFPARVAGFWASGLPYLDAAVKSGDRPWEAGFQLPLASVDVSGALAALGAMPERLWHREAQSQENAVMSGRDENMNRFKPGVDGLVLLFSSNDAAGDPSATVFEFPLWRQQWRRVLEPLLAEILGPADLANIVRLQLARMRPGVSDIKRHVDSGGYAKHAHRIHVVLTTNTGVAFETCGERAPAAGGDGALGGGGGDGNQKDPQPAEVCYILPTQAGLVFELNNRCGHNVANKGETERVHLVVDVDELPHPRAALAPGSQCHYDARLKLLCPLPGEVAQGQGQEHLVRGREHKVGGGFLEAGEVRAEAERAAKLRAKLAAAQQAQAAAQGQAQAAVPAA